MRILILDDQPGLADMLALSLQMSGHTAKGFTSPYEALDAIQNFDVLVTDYDMPDMTGLEVARRAHDQGWRGSLLLMSGRSAALTDTVEHPLLRLILTKPFSAQELLDALPAPQ